MGARVRMLGRGGCLSVRRFCDRYERFRREWKGVALRESKSGLVPILGYEGISDKLESVTKSMLGAIWRERELWEREQEQ